MPAISVWLRSAARWVEDDIQKQRLLDGEILRIDILAYSLGEPLARKLGTELVVRVVVVDTVCKPYLLQILLHCNEVGIRTVAVILIIYSLQRAAHGEVILEVLVEQNITTSLCSLCQIVDQGLLLQWQLLEARHLVAQNLDIVKFIYNPWHGLRSCALGLGRCAAA